MIGRVIASRYRITERIGRGGMGAVYRGEHVRMRRKTAIKILATALANSPEFVARFEREAELASTLNHPNAVAIYDFGEAEDGLVYLAMELLDGEPLSAVLARRGTLPLGEVVGIARQAASALHAAHQLGIVHRDFKPDNVMLCRGPGGGEVVKVVDFGIAKQTRPAVGAESLTQTGSVLGTPTYMSPEQVAGEPLDARSDLYSLALTVYQLLSGRIPFSGDTPQSVMVQRLLEPPAPLRALAPHVHPAVEAVVMRGLARRREERYASAAEFAEALERAASAPPAAMPTPLYQTPVAPPASFAAHPTPPFAGTPHQASTYPNAPAAATSPYQGSQGTVPTAQPAQPLGFYAPTPPTVARPATGGGSSLKYAALAAAVLFVVGAASVAAWVAYDEFARPAPIAPLADGPRPAGIVVPNTAPAAPPESPGADPAAGVASYAERARDLRDAEDYAAAEQAARDAVAAFPDSAVAHAVLAEVLLEQSKLSSGSEAARRAVSLDGESADARAALALSHLNQIDYARATEEAKRALSLSPGPDAAALAHLTIGVAATEQKRFDDALAAFGRVAEAGARDSLSVAAEVGAADVRGQQGDAARAIRELRALAEGQRARRGAKASCYVRIARFQFLGEENDAALQSCERAFELAVSDLQRAAARIVQAFVYVKTGRPADALRASEYALARAGEDRYVRGYAYATKGMALYLQGQPREGLAALEQAAKLIPNDTDLQQILQTARSQAS